MRKMLIFMVAAAVLTVGCKGRDEVYKASDGSYSAVHHDAKWVITGPDGNDLVPDCDSMRVVERGEDGHPLTVYCYKEGRQTVLQFYSSMALRMRGDVVDGRRDGLWQYFYENGSPQVEATYVDGREDGEYRVYRESGVPYYVGRYKAGARVGVWEVYDADGNLVEAKQTSGDVN